METWLLLSKLAVELSTVDKYTFVVTICDTNTFIFYVFKACPNFPQSFRRTHSYDT